MAILQGLPWRGGMPAAGILAGKEQTLETYSAQLQKSWDSTKQLFGFIKNLWANEISQGGHTLSRRQGPPGGPPVAIFCYKESLDGKKS